MQPTHSHTVPRELVHRASVAEVFVTSVTGRDVSVQLPRSHAFYGDSRAEGPPRYDPLAFLEASRQACLAQAHERWDVPLGLRFLVRRLAMRVEDSAALLIGDRPCDAVLRTCPVRTFEAGLCLRHRVEIGGRHALTTEFSFSWLSERAWRRLRGKPRTTPVEVPAHCPPATVGRRDPRNVVIGPPARDGDLAYAAVTVEARHPTLFDHPVDHLPGMAQLEACRQLALAGSGRRPESGQVTAMQATFHRFAELGTPTSGRCRMREQRDGEATASAQVVQGGRVVADAELALTFPPSPVPVRRLAMAGNPREF